MLQPSEKIIKDRINYLHTIRDIIVETILKELQKGLKKQLIIENEQSIISKIEKFIKDYNSNNNKSNTKLKQLAVIYESLCCEIKVLKNRIKLDKNFILAQKDFNIQNELYSDYLTLQLDKVEQGLSNKLLAKIADINIKNLRFSVFSSISVIITFIGFILTVLSLPVFSLSNMLIVSLPLLSLGMLLLISTSLIRFYFNRRNKKIGLYFMIGLGLSMLIPSLMLGFLFPFLLPLSLSTLLVIGTIGGSLVFFALQKLGLQAFRKKTTWGSGGVALITYLMLAVFASILLLSTNSLMFGIGLSVFTFSFVFLSIILIENLLISPTKATTSTSNLSIRGVWSFMALFFSGGLAAIGVLNAIGGMIVFPVAITFLSLSISIFFIGLILCAPSPTWFKTPSLDIDIKNPQKKNNLLTPDNKYHNEKIVNFNNNNFPSSNLKKTCKTNSNNMYILNNNYGKGPGKDHSYSN